MRYGSGWFLRMLVAVVAIGVLMSLAFGAGLAADGGSVNSAWDGHHYQPCLRMFGCLFGLFLLIVVIGMIGCAFRGPRPHYFGGPGYRYGRRWHGWSDEDWRSELDAELADWHTRMHGQGGSSEPAPPTPETRKGGRSK
jgi:hypothetical protein